MASGIQLVLLGACREFMRPLVRLLLKNGIGYREFSELCKEIFVGVASDDHGIRGRKTNMSRVAVMTGLSRKEVRKLRDAEESGALPGIGRTLRPELVLSIWHTDAEFIDARHKPKRISFEGPGANFRDLVARAGGDIPPRAMLNELLRAGSVVEEGEKLRAVSRSYVPEPNDPEAMLVAGGAIRDLVRTIHYNLGCNDPEARFLERRVYSENLPKSQRIRFRKLSREKGELLLTDLSSWLSERSKRTDDAMDTPTSGRIGVGVYFFDDATIAPRSNSPEKGKKKGA
jgi:hypothetical protein